MSYPLNIIVTGAKASSSIGLGPGVYPEHPIADVGVPISSVNFYYGKEYGSIVGQTLIMTIPGSLVQVINKV